MGGEEKKKRGGKKKGEGWKITQRMRAAFILEDQNTEHEVVSSSVDGSNSVGQGGGATMTVEGQLTPVTDAYASLSLAPTPSAPSLSEPSPLPAQPAPPAPPAPPPPRHMRQRATRSHRLHQLRALGPVLVVPVPVVVVLASGFITSHDV